MQNKYFSILLTPFGIVRPRSVPRHNDLLRSALPKQINHQPRRLVVRRSARRLRLDQLRHERRNLVGRLQFGRVLEPHLLVTLLLCQRLLNHQLGRLHVGRIGAGQQVLRDLVEHGRFAERPLLGLHIGDEPLFESVVLGGNVRNALLAQHTVGLFDFRQLRILAGPHEHQVHEAIADGRRRRMRAFGRDKTDDFVEETEATDVGAEELVAVVHACFEDLVYIYEI